MYNKCGFNSNLSENGVVLITIFHLIKLWKRLILLLL